MNIQLRQLGEKSADARALVPPTLNTTGVADTENHWVYQAKGDGPNGSSDQSLMAVFLRFRIIESKFGAHKTAQDLP